MKHHVRTIALLLAATMMLAACGDDDTAASDSDTAAPGSDADTTTTVDNVDDNDDDDNNDDNDNGGSAEPAGGGTLEIVLDDGRSWSLEQYKCNYSPDNEGVFVELWGAGAVVPTGGEFVVLMATPADPDSTENLLTGSLIDDANGVLFPIVEGEAVSDGTTMTMTLGMYRDGLRVVGDPIDFTATVTCSL